MQTKHDSKSRRLSIGEASQRLGVHPDTLRRWETAGRISSTRTLGNQRRYEEIDIDALADGHSPETGSDQR